jgi:hypothetical protein
MYVPPFEILSDRVGYGRFFHPAACFIGVSPLSAYCGIPKNACLDRKRVQMLVFSLQAQFCWRAIISFYGYFFVSGL